MNETLSQKTAFLLGWGQVREYVQCTVNICPKTSIKNFIKTAKQNPEEEKGRKSKELRRQEGDSARNTVHSGSPVLSSSQFLMRARTKSNAEPQGMCHLMHPVLRSWACFLTLDSHVSIFPMFSFFIPLGSQR